MVLKIYNDLTRTKEVFKPLHDKKVGIYVCGPTIYDYGHIGHGRSAVSFDLFRRYLIFKGYDVKFIFNYTDIDDKMINRANKEGISVKELGEKFTKIYDEDYAKLNILKPSVKPKPTHEIEAVINIIKKLEENNHIYTIENDGVYFDISTFSEYGKLSHQNINDLQAGSRIKVGDKKKNPQDFVIWKFAKPNEPFWDSPWGKGRPGWHIECSAMSLRYIGETLDIHGGGADLIFPHHECEIAQSEGATKKPFAKYWMHNGFVQIDKEKMSKSLGNFKTMRDIFQNYDPLVIRYFMLSTHYKAPINFSKEALESAKHSLERINNFILTLKEKQGEEENKLIDDLISKAKFDFTSAMDNDLSISEALAVIFDLIKEINKLQISKEDANKILNFMKELDSVLGVMTFESQEIPKEILDLVEKRIKAKENKNYELADKLRDEIKEKGYLIEDTKQGSRVKTL